MSTPWTTERIGPAPFISVDHMGSGELLIFLHGIGGNKRNWHDNLPAFGAHFHAVAWDARGYGESDDYEGPLHFSDFSKDLLRVIDHFGAKKAHIVGLSMGGRIAMDFAENHQDRIATLTLCDTHRGMSHFPPEKKAEFLRLRKEPLMNGGTPKDIAHPVAKSLSGPNISPEAYGKLIDSLSRLHKESYIKSLEASVMTDTHNRLGEITVPTHIVVGSEDRLTDVDMARQLNAMIKDSSLSVIDDAGHLPNIEKPREFDAAVLGFLVPLKGKYAA